MASGFALGVLTTLFLGGATIGLAVIVAVKEPWEICDECSREVKNHDGL